MYFLDNDDKDIQLKLSDKNRIVLAGNPDLKEAFEISQGETIDDDFQAFVASYLREKARELENDANLIEPETP